MNNKEEASLIEAIQAAIVEAVLPEPITDETEPAYTARVVQPIVSGLIKKIDYPGLVVGGHGSFPTHAVSFMSLQFIPDCEVSYRGKRVVAIENKFIGINQRQRQLTNAIGQATVYTVGGYGVSIALLLDFETLTYSIAEQPVSFFGNGSIRLIIKRRNHLGQFVS